MDAMPRCALPGNCRAERVIGSYFSVYDQTNCFGLRFAFDRSRSHGIKKCSFSRDTSATDDNLRSWPNFAILVIESTVAKSQKDCRDFQCRKSHRDSLNAANGLNGVSLKRI
jgi:ribonuclease BN (tRNA processing enzyme)